MIDSWLISIVTIVFNDSKGLTKTLQSIKEQNYNSIEYIVIDGGSTDGTIEVIENETNSIDFYLSEQDEGIYDAMNKGLNYCSGDFVLFLNAGDHFASPHALSEVVSQIIDANAIYFGRAKIQNNKIIWFYPPNTVNNSESAIQWANKYLPNHQSMLFPKSFYTFNQFDPVFQILGDTDYKIRAIKNNDLIFIDTVLVSFQLGGVSSSCNNWKTVVRQVKEYLLMANIHYKKKIFYPLLKLRALKFILKYIVNKIIGFNNFSVTLKWLATLKHKLLSISFG
ncbi:glycosyltransferase family 2 protein [Coleofasciculus sp. E2-BRE-01]|uniref:glycosyltransferase family 2 protein n=1 Tax=Coleofasciculus sp. E2-BRE-01 TaxID=3069524 RepID=UPI0032FCD5AB